MSATTPSTLVERLRAYALDWRERASDASICEQAAKVIEAGTMRDFDTPEILRYVGRYGGRCRDCADEHGVCPMSGLSCEPEEADKAIRHVLRAVTYGLQNNFLTPPDPAPPVALIGEAARLATIAHPAFRAYGYQGLFNAIATAVKIEGAGIGISVRQFLLSLIDEDNAGRPHAPPTPIPIPQSKAKPL